MIDAFNALATSITGIVTNAISGNWGALASSIVDTVRDSLGVGSAAIGSVADLGSSATDTATQIADK